MASTRKLLSLFLVAVFVAAQWAGYLHALSHAKYDLAVALAAAGHGGDAGRQAPPLDHSADHCVAFHALDSVASGSPLVVSVSGSACPTLTAQHVLLLPSATASYSSRAPPALS